MTLDEEVEIVWNDKTVKKLTAVLSSIGEAGITVKKNGKILIIPYTAMRVYYQDEVLPQNAS